MKLKTDFIRAAVEGKTADGRDITAEQLQQIAASYHQDTYNARIWPEHIRGVMPDGLFKALGDVVEVKAERIKGGALDGKTALYVKIEPHPDLIAMVRSGQKVHLSVEIDPRFADTGKAY
ncbi:GPO family capsid scaffolding protein [Thiothrix subterranea]|uniref:GPO family capsid scaffolding protein n=1 Tax=Thiothrix subterranea TaxID=2735563 RepID=A0AA51MI99_9GAMM|nr:GPO family capsid scaffolding protein [Thiothrix subterranea]MDQ5771007.1 GPO family capsid scaffolding protein [Thiothrix subterranea]WML84972.1 GPO family capsid scaffolding protein [Thiothrix subterranea]